MKVNNSEEYVSPSVEILCVDFCSLIAASGDKPGAGGSEGTGEEEI